MATSTKKTVAKNGVQTENNDVTSNFRNYYHLINGTTGNDVLYGGSLNDYIDGREGNDILNGKGGSNLFVFRTGSGKDIIENDIGTDTVSLTANTGIKFSHNMANQDLSILYGNNDSVTLQDYYVNNSHSVKNIIYNSSSSTLEDAIERYGVDIQGTIYNDNIVGSNGSDTIFGNKGNDTILAGDGDDIIEGGRGKDYLDGGDGHNKFVFNTGDGFDTIANSTGVDMVVLNDRANIHFEHDLATKNLVMNYGSGDYVSLAGYYFDNNHSVKLIQNGSELLTVKDAINTYGIHIRGTEANDTLQGSIANDILYAGKGNDVLTGGRGNDILDGGAGQNSYMFNAGDGHDTIVNNGTALSKDYIIFSNQTNISLSHDLSNNDLIINYGNNDSITLQDYFVNNSHSVRGIRNGNGAAVKTINTLISENGITTINTSLSACSMSDVNKLAEDVAGWTCKGEYAAPQDVANDSNSADINALIAAYQSDTNYMQLQK